MTALLDLRDEIADLLEAAGITTITDPRKFTPPGVLIDVPTQIDPIGRAGYRVTVPVYVVAAGPANTDGLLWALEHVEQVLAVFAGQAASPALLQAFTWQNQQLAAYAVNVTISTPTHR